ncbi:hypothetical protein TIN4_41 [Tsukamurella phage TIN4]|uniref:Uncharacterized protein n=2 Tax=Tinduovirus TIN3 TaxID=1982571 RepID=A0A0K0N6A1_9CAUD|nr:hypothetical protein AVT54_gp084 [Tsukamurella phage TIN3]YP_009604171.1 hypothetical protein FDH87_gp084 [Tsukamurella phage TIN4]AKJ71838.1 hypothetical protein TIN3_41 [Tsukamurella phage TIN3]AKJ71947.1 hypothetical protein TIN4_41 [Tsukamurella phage TIN4]
MKIKITLDVDDAILHLDSASFKDAEAPTDDEKTDAAFNVLEDLFLSNDDVQGVLDDIGGSINNIDLEDVEISDDREIEIDG